jgi:hypothetical protein
MRDKLYVSGLVNQNLLVQNEYLAAENRILKSQRVLPPPGFYSLTSPGAVTGGV